MVKTKAFLVCFCLGTCVLQAQKKVDKDSIMLLPEVVVSDSKLRDFSKGYVVKGLKPALTLRYPQSATRLFQENSTLYFKENSIGGVSSVSFRGTSAAHTAVLWNGIPINSELTGQTDFNALSVTNFDAISIRNSGGSVSYGSGAIGGSIHLNTIFRFSDHFEPRFSTSYGSYQTSTTNFKIKQGTNKTTYSFGLAHVQSENKYPFLGTDKENTNGAYDNRSYAASIGHKLSSQDVLKVFFNSYIGDRNFSSTLFTKSNDGYQDTNYRSMVQWQHYGNRFVSEFSMAHLLEGYRYFSAVTQKENFSFGKAVSYLNKFDSSYTFNNDSTLRGIVSQQFTIGSGTNIKKSNRAITSFSLLWSQELANRVQYGMQLRQEVRSDYTAPLLFAADVAYKFSDKLILKGNYSKNFRAPSFNDLHWEGQGNPALLPEKSQQFSISQKLKLGDFEIKSSQYDIRTTQLIQWKPNSSGVWKPDNVENTSHKGFELSGNYILNIKKSKVIVATEWAYVSARNSTTKKTLVFVPKHTMRSSCSFVRKKWSATLNTRGLNPVFITTDNSKQLDGYAIVNGSIEHTFNYKPNGHTIRFQLMVQNVFNHSYKLQPSRPAPNRNFTFQILIN